MGIEEIVSQVKQRLGQTSLSDRTLTEYFTSISPSGEPDEAFFTTHEKILKSLGGQYNHDIAEWQKKYEDDHKKKDTPPAPPTPPTPPTGIDPNVQALLDKQNKTLEELSKIVLSQQKSKSEGDLRAAAVTYGESLKCEKPELWKSAMKFTPIGDGMTEAQYNEAVKTNYESLIAASGNGVKPYNNGQGGAPEDNSKAIEAFFKSKFGDPK